MVNRNFHFWLTDHITPRTTRIWNNLSVKLVTFYCDSFFALQTKVKPLQAVLPKLDFPAVFIHTDISIQTNCLSKMPLEAERTS